MLTRIARIVFALALWIGLAATPLAAGATESTACPCWPGGVPLGNPLVCYDAPGATVNAFAYLSPPPTFLQATGAWCRDGASFAWTTPDQSMACEEAIQCLCDGGATPEELCNDVDDDCNPATYDDPNADGDPVSFCDEDCDDNDSSNYPGNAESCTDGQDNDCDDDVDCDDSECSSHGACGGGGTGTGTGPGPGGDGGPGGD